MDNKAVFKYLGIKQISNMPVYTDIKLLGCLNGFFIFPYSNYWVVKGKMPLAFADELYCFRDTLGIRVAGGANSNKPIDWCTSDEFEEYRQEQSEQIELTGVEEFCVKLKSKKEQLIHSNIGSFYIEMYHIDKLEGLKKVVDIIKKYGIKTEW